ncbi:MAG: LytTR family DNA-binding domain-containing protein [Bacteroidota bacterium]
MLSAIIIDDEEDAREVLRGLINLFCPEISIILEASEGEAALKEVTENKIDIAFVDIELRKESGLELAQQLFSFCPNVIFVTAHDKYAVEAFQMQAIHYLLKPVVPQYLQEAVKRVETDQQVQDQPHKLLLPTRSGMIVLNQEEVIRIQGDGNYCYFHCVNDQQHYLSRNLAYYQKLVSEDLFFRAHQSHLVNLKYVRSVDADGQSQILLANGDLVPLSKSRKQILIQILQNG